MRTRNEKQYFAKKIEIMEKAFDCFAENGLHSVGIRGIAEACGCTSATLYQYFDDLDDLIIQSTAYCMAKVEDDFMQMAPTDAKDVMRFIEEAPYGQLKSTAKNTGLCTKYILTQNILSMGKSFLRA